MATKKRSNPVAEAAKEVLNKLPEHDRLPRGSARQVGSTLSRGPGMLTQYLVPQDISRLIEYERASKTDETVGTGIEFMKLALIASLKEYRHPDPQIQAFVRKSLEEMESTIDYCIGELAESSLTFGFSVSEILWKLVDGRIQIDELINYHPASLLIVPNIHGRLEEGPLDNPYYMPPAPIDHNGIWQIGVDGATYNWLPLNKVCLTVHSKRSGIYYGTSAIQRVYKNWMLKDIVLEMYNVALDRYGTPISYAVVPAGVTPDLINDPTTGKVRNMTIREAAEAAMSNMHRGTSLVFQRPSMQDDIKIDTLTTGNNFGTVFLDAINYYNRAIFRGLLIPQLLLEEGSAGLSNPGQTHWNTFKLMISALAKEIIRPFTKQVIGRMIQLNFKDTRCGEFVIEPFDPAISQTLASVFADLVNTGYLTASSEDDLNEVRELFGLPTKDVKPLISEEDHRRIIVSPAEKIANDKLKAQAAMVKAKSSEIQANHNAGAGFAHKQEMDKAELDQKRAELNMKRQDIKSKQQQSMQKSQQDHQFRMQNSSNQHRQSMAAIKSGKPLPGKDGVEPQQGSTNTPNPVTEEE
jgi:hypothetical protein